MSANRAATAGGLSVVFLIVFWTLRFGALSLLVVPVLALWIWHVYLGGPFNGPPSLAYARLRELWNEHR